MYRSILVPLDGSQLSEAALPVASEIARRSGATLHLLLVTMRAMAAPIFVEALPVVDEDMHSLGKTHDQAYLEQIRDRLTAAGELPVTVAVLDPLAADDHEQTIPGFIAAYAVANGVDLIVMTTHGRGGITRFWLGSVADALIRLSPAPILLLRSHDEASGLGQAAPARRILIPLDGSARSEAVVAPALALGQLLGAEYTLLHIVVPAVLGPAAPFTTPTDFNPERTRRDEAEAQRYLEEVAGRLRGLGATVGTRVLVGDQVALAILEETQRESYDLIAMSTAGRSGIRRLLIGSVADKVLRRAEAPLLLHREDPPSGSAS
jgi:nucleotide-binding universal stress UspA family protein